MENRSRTFQSTPAPNAVANAVWEFDVANTPEPVRAAPKSKRAADRDSNSFNFINPPMNLVFCAAPQNPSAAARFAVCLRQGDSDPHCSVCLTIKMQKCGVKLQVPENIWCVEL